MAMKSITKYLIVFLFIITSSASFAWSEKDTIWQAAYLASHIADWGQTRDIASQCEHGEYYETNPIIGRCPDKKWVNTYFFTTALLHTGIAHMMPSKYRRMFQAGTLGMELSYITNNARIGLSVEF